MLYRRATLACRLSPVPGDSGAGGQRGSPDPHADQRDAATQYTPYEDPDWWFSHPDPHRNCHPYLDPHRQSDPDGYRNPDPHSQPHTIPYTLTNTHGNHHRHPLADLNTPGGLSRCILEIR